MKAPNPKPLVGDIAIYICMREAERNRRASGWGSGGGRDWLFRWWRRSAFKSWCALCDFLAVSSFTFGFSISNCCCLPPPLLPPFKCLEQKRSFWYSRDEGDGSNKSLPERGQLWCFLTFY
ncbi:hypothetical protein AVEN_267801-1 [Araneus ventricosus]|uniref:Uncharacterized protein n=1 Tax=Araneus ventricosus TaxID=182803 RepID=A0A4Y2D5H0_ARAVE|nr:hypothetical protein AVEN_267801-1 [Araneus ventricosus]